MYITLQLVPALYVVNNCFIVNDIKYKIILLCVYTDKDIKDIATYFLGKGYQECTSLLSDCSS